jgi:hypothetical protein
MANMSLLGIIGKGTFDQRMWTLVGLNRARVTEP